MKLQSQIEKQKDNILKELFEWAETFEWELDEDGEKTKESYDLVYSLAKRLENGKCSSEDYKSIQFHIDQINYNEIKIQL